MCIYRQNTTIYIYTVTSLAVKFLILWHTPHEKKTENLIIIIFTHYRSVTLTYFNTTELSVLHIYMYTDNFLNSSLAKLLYELLLQFYCKENFTM